MNKLSLVVPCFNEEASLPYFFEEIRRVAAKLESVELELLFVDDGSTDGTLALIKQYRKEYSCVRYVSFSRNFGKEAAMLAGLTEATGDYVAVMDADMQDPPSLLPDMYKAVSEEGFDCAATRRVTRKGEPKLRSMFANGFYRLMGIISKTEIVDGARDFRLMSRTMTDAILSVQEYNRFSKGIFGWVGFKTKWIPFENTQRVAGKTKWSFWSLFMYSIEGIIDFSAAPLAIASFTGLFFCLLSLILVLFIFFQTLIYGNEVADWPSLACIIFFVGGVQLFCTGILGGYLAKTYTETKNRPKYIVKEKE